MNRKIKSPTSLHLICTNESGNKTSGCACHSLGLIHFNVITCFRDPGIRGGRLFPALYTSSQPHQPGGDQC